MVHPHARGRGLGNLSVLEVLLQLVPVPVGADGQGQREKCKDARMEKLPECSLRGRTRHNHTGRSPEVR